MLHKSPIYCRWESWNADAVEFLCFILIKPPMNASKFTNRTIIRGVSTGGISVFIPPKSAQVNFLWGKNDVRTAIQQFYTPKNFYTPPNKNKFLATPLVIIANFSEKEAQLEPSLSPVGIEMEQPCPQPTPSWPAVQAAHSPCPYERQCGQTQQTQPCLLLPLNIN